LSQHFMADIFVGALIGCIAAYLSVLWMNLWEKPFMNHNILSIFKK